MRQVGIFGKRKSGKSALMYALTKHKIKATFKAMEIGSVTKVMLVDTVGVDVEDDSTAEKSAQSVEVSLMLITDDSFEVISQADKFPDGGEALAVAVKEVSGMEALCVSSVTGAGIEELDEEINRRLSKE